MEYQRLSVLAGRSNSEFGGNGIASTDTQLIAQYTQVNTLTASQNAYSDLVNTHTCSDI